MDTDDGPIWQMDLYGRPSRYLGPVHGYAGNMIPLLRGWDWLTEAQRERVTHGVGGRVLVDRKRQPSPAL